MKEEYQNMIELLHKVLQSDLDRLRRENPQLTEEDTKLEKEDKNLYELYDSFLDKEISIFKQFIALKQIETERHKKLEEKQQQLQEKKEQLIQKIESITQLSQQCDLEEQRILEEGSITRMETPDTSRDDTTEVGADIPQSGSTTSSAETPLQVTTPESYKDHQ